MFSTWSDPLAWQIVGALTGTRIEAPVEAVLNGAAFQHSVLLSKLLAVPRRAELRALAVHSDTDDRRAKG